MKKSIPKIIHYCWFGKNKLPDSAKQCIKSWHRYFPECEVKEWNEYNFDVNLIPYTKEAYKAKKYAFVSDYARFWIIYNYGGIYFDVDVEVIKSMDDIIDRGAFMGYEREKDGKTIVAPGLGIAAPSGLDFYAKMLELYSKLHFIREDGSYDFTTIVAHTTDVFISLGMEQKLERQFVDDILLYPSDYFDPKDFNTNEIFLTKNTRTIHHYAGSWFPLYKKIIYKLPKIIGQKAFVFFLKIKQAIIG